MTREEAIVLLECGATEAVGVLAATTEPSAAKQLQRYIDAYDMAIAALREQPQWISVEDRLPEAGKRVLVFREGFLKGDKFVDIDVRVRIASNGTETEWADNLRTWKSVVTHWMPPPEPPEVEE